LSRRVSSEALCTIPAGSCIYVVVKNVAPGGRLRVLVWDAEGEDTDIHQGAARAIFESAAPPNTWEIEAETRRLAEALAR
jgi:hypothetical protein